MVGLPLEKARPADRSGRRKWLSPRHRDSVGKTQLVRPVSFGQAAPEENLPALDLEVQPPSVLSMRHFCILSAMSLLVILLVWGLVRSNHLSVALSYEISTLAQERLTLQEANRQLKTELTGVGSLAQLEEAARNVLGLITPNQGQIVVVEP
jgi:cell division protein FtsL